MIKNIMLFFFAAFLLSSCKTKQKASEINYMQSVEEMATTVSINSNISTIQKGDQLVIFVSAKNMDVVKPFNQNYYNNQSPTTTNNINSEKSYLVDSEGNIDFPVVGQLSTTGKTLEALKYEITEKVSKYVKNPTITVRLSNFKVTILGEVNSPGQYTIPENQATLLNAIGIAGDLTIYGKRDNILMIRNINGNITRERINLMQNFTSSPFYNLKQGDVIYVSANETKEKIARQDPNTGIYIAVAGMIIGLAGIFITIFKN